MLGSLILKAKLGIIGRRENKRLERMLFHITKEQKGLEIGPSLRPCAAKREGYQVEIVDHLNQEELIKKYSAMNLDVSRIEEVDYVWDGRKYSELTGRKDYYDYIIASHVIEHTKDFIGFLQDCSEMLKEDGILSLAIPDKRYTLDHFRTITAIGQVIDDYLNPEKQGTTGALMDYAIHVIKRRGLTSWARERDFLLKRDYEFVHNTEHNKRLYAEAIRSKGFHDIHHYVFTPASFELLIAQLQEYGFINLKIETFYNTIGEEFCVSMKKTKEFDYLSDSGKKKLLRLVSRQNVIR